MAYIWAVLWALVLLGLGSISNPPGPDTELPLDKLVHLAVYGVLGVLVAHGWVRAGRRPGAVLVIVAALLVGVLDEFNQSRVAGRSAEVADWIMDAVGIMGGFALLAKRSRRPPQEQE